MKVVWTMDGGSQLLFVSDDGQHVAMIYGGSTLIPLDADDSRDLIIFWEAGRKVASIPLATLVPDRAILVRTASHYSWGYIRGLNASNQLVVERIDGRVFNFNMATGRPE
ncbi:MAG TPA: hypothetical protein VLT89_08855 [Usitatibacter sp.]|nr:hypothetical protein [Usitatibacter sp.]